MENQTDPLGLSPRAIYFLLSWAGGFFDQQDELLAGSERFESPAEVLVRALSTGAARILRRGPDRVYAEHQYREPLVRGRLDAGRTMRADRGRGRIAVSTLAELTGNCPQNDLIRTALHRSALMDALGHEVREYARIIDRAFPGRVLESLADVTRAFRMLRLHRNNAAYRSNLFLARLIIHSTRLSAGTYRFNNPFTRKLLHQLFERMLVRFFRQDLKRSATVGAEILNWNDGLRPPSALLPVLRTDMTIRAPDRCLVLDAKYYKDMFVEHHGKRTFRSGHLCQIYSYCLLSRSRDLLERPWQGALVYARNNEAFEQQIDLHGIPVRIVGLDLEAGPDIIMGGMRSVWER
jgi:5-methylcytosine-specific restriction enzyme subunit McrC